MSPLRVQVETQCPPKAREYSDMVGDTEMIFFFLAAKDQDEHKLCYDAKCKRWPIRALPS